jgi:hypothetical protein
MTGSVGSHLLNKELTGSIYDVEAMKLHGMESLGKPLVCQGKQCFGLSLTIMAIGTFFGGLISLILAARMLNFIKVIYTKGTEVTTRRLRWHHLL